ncbi:16S rRNA (guanine(966)-N(2))-methyltransferase RsmD [Caedibacter taeniospiralis]|uniref:16S rRNA (guanine(966)-N(2))-methyltransferase RsmD n=1 Tax=Caedibacter taeniospiralis TaxID=28907 RepID=UPI000C27A242|nr:16S rRNA (guanine(966)-N(2))-methyltransferase RsmD [Caedibacter taeniospiralis]
MAYPPKTTTPSSSKIRIISGKYKAHHIEFSARKNADLRPTSDRLRETLFNWLMPYIVEAKCLDAFAGSGALGFEALSRLAKSCDFFELDAQAIKQLEHTKNKLNADNANIYHANVLSHVQHCLNYQLIFLDPPFKSELLSEALSLILANENISQDALIYAEYPTITPPDLLVHFSILKQTRQGAVSACLLRKQ